MAAMGGDKSQLSRIGPVAPIEDSVLAQVHGERPAILVVSSEARSLDSPQNTSGPWPRPSGQRVVLVDDCTLRPGYRRVGNAKESLYTI